MKLDPALLRSLRIDRPDDIRRAAICLRDAVDDLCGLRTAVSHNIAVSVPMRDAAGEVLASSVFGFIAEADRWWLSPQLALHSPLTAVCRVEAEPFWCNAAGIYARHQSLFVDAIDLTGFAARAMTRSAIVVPVHLPFAQIGAASFLPKDPQMDDLSEEFDRFSDLLAVYAKTFVASYVEVLRPRPFCLPNIALTKREVEVLRWAAVGKTNEEVGTILGLSRATIRFHIRNAGGKLKAVNRDQTLLKATQLGFMGMVL